jgi:hypothetical protein
LPVAATVPVLAHHAFSAEFDAKAPVTLRGPVTKIEWINPHAWIHMENKDGRTGRARSGWSKAVTPNTLQRNGIARRFDQGRHGDRRVGISREGRAHARQRPRHHLPRRPDAVHGLVGHRRAARRKDPNEKPKAERSSDDATRCGRSGARRHHDGRVRWSRGSAASRSQAFRAPRTPDGVPNISGIWQANNTANWDLEPHEARMGPVVALAAAFSIPAASASLKVTRFRICRPALEKRNQNRADWVKLDPEVKCYMPGIPARDLHAVSVQIVQSKDNVLFTYEFTSASRVVRMNTQEKSPAPAWMGWYGRQVGRRIAGDRSDRSHAGHVVRSRRELPQRRAKGDGTLHAHRCEHARLRATIEDPQCFRSVEDQDAAAIRPPRANMQ